MIEGPLASGACARHKIVLDLHASRCESQRRRRYTMTLRSSGSSMTRLTDLF